METFCLKRKFIQAILLYCPYLIIILSPKRKHLLNRRSNFMCCHNRVCATFKVVINKFAILLVWSLFYEISFTIILHRRLKTPDIIALISCFSITVRKLTPNVSIELISSTKTPSINMISFVG